MNKNKIATIIATAVTIGAISGNIAFADDTQNNLGNDKATIGSRATNGKGQVINVSTNLNIRKSASTSSTVVGKIPANATFEIISKSGSWYKIKYGSVTGYVSGDYVKVISMPSTSTGSDSSSGDAGNSGGSNSNSNDNNSNTITNGKGKVINVSTNLNIRKSASTSSTVVGKIPANVTFEIISKSGSWYKIKYGSVTGYVSGDYVKVISMPSTDTDSDNDSDDVISGGDDNNSSGSGNENDSTSTVKYGIVVNVSSGSTLRVRASANTSSSVLGYLSPNQKVEIVSESNGWYKIKFNNGYGYVSSSYIDIIDYNPDNSQDQDTTAKFNKVFDKMKSQLGSPYVYGGAGEIITESLITKLQGLYPNQSYSVPAEYYDGEWRAFDCSGLMQWGFKEAGVNLGRNTAAQINNGVEVSLENLQPGDLIFYKTLTHVGMYIGDGMWIESPRTGLSVRITNVPWSLVERARRVL